MNRGSGVARDLLHSREGGGKGSNQTQARRWRTGRSHVARKIAVGGKAVPADDVLVDASSRF